jgi:2-keto-4-pentenoate hydratase/2-oxohepta-3-ene-1,7-dioic acid hydratase in catechol pathway
MRYGNLSGRLTLFVDGGAVDVEKASAGRFGPDPQAVHDVWDEFREWARTAPTVDAAGFAVGDVGAPTPAPAQIFAIGLNYADHAAESRLALPDRFPPVFTKFRTALSGPATTVALPSGGRTDWEVELVVVIGRRAHRVSESDAWSYVAGLTVGQDISERVLQMVGSVPQFSLGKSYPGFGPTGPWIVTPDELSDRDDLPIGCSVNGVSKQEATTKLLMRSVGKLVERLSAVTPLLPGDLIFTGTPAGVGLARNPPEFLSPGDVIDSYITGIGEIRTTIVAAR